jgi:microcystin-dependent protein
MSQPFVGEIRMVGFNFAPVGWAFCDGSTQSIDQNTALFQLIGTTYGGDGTTTYNLPNLLGRLPIHQGIDTSGNPYVLGQISGTETVTLTTQQIPSHNHPLQAASSAATMTNPTALTLAASNVDVYVTPTSPTATIDASTLSGGSQPHDNLMPFLCINFIISLFGIFPSQ